ncbi:MAG: LysE family translocator [Sedimenticola sp.]
MGIIESISLLGIMAALAAIPSTSVALVVIRSATLGIANGVAAAAGIVVGDLVFIMLAILGLSVISEAMGSLFMVVKYLGATYLLWLGFSLLRAGRPTRISPGEPLGAGNDVTSFFAGLVLTLGDVKAILFYISLFPMFMDLTTLQVADVLTIVAVTVIGVGGVKIAYALSAAKIAGKAKGFKYEKAARKTAGCFMIGAGSYMIAKG